MQGVLKSRWVVAVRVALLSTALILGGCGKDKISDPQTVVTPGGGTDPVPHAVIGANRYTGDAPFVVSFSNQSTNGTRCEWSFGDGASSTEWSPSHTYTSLGRYTANLTVYNSKGATSTDQRVVTAYLLVRPFGVGGRVFGPYYPSLTQGDCDFGGHGPDVWMDAKLSVASSNPARLQLNASMRAVETQADWTTGVVNVATIIYTAPSGTRIETLPDVSELHEAYQDNGWGLATTAGNALGSFTWKGDTDGNDVCGTTSDDTQMFVNIKGIQLRLGPSQ